MIVSPASTAIKSALYFFIVFKVLKDYESKRKTKEYPKFIAKDIGLDDSNLDYWKE